MLNINLGYLLVEDLYLFKSRNRACSTDILILNYMNQDLECFADALWFIIHKLLFISKNRQKQIDF